MLGMDNPNFISPSGVPYEQVDFSWMVGHVVREVTFHDGGVWRFAFAPSEYIQTYCLWRIIREERVVLASEDHGQQFGWAAPMDAGSMAREAFSAATIRAVELTKATADILIDFDGDLRLEIIPTSCGYEGWEIRAPDGICFVAQGGGQICTWIQPVGQNSDMANS
jgi:hypothetical protein